MPYDNCSLLISRKDTKPYRLHIKYQYVFLVHDSQYMHKITTQIDSNVVYTLNEMKAFGFIFKMKCKYLFIICFVNDH